MATHDPEHVEDKIDRLHTIHNQATGKPSQAGKAEASNSHSMRDAADAMLSWGAGQPVVSQGRGDTTKFPDAASGVSATRVTATEPAVLDRFGTIPGKGRLGAYGVDEIAGATPLSNPDIVKGRR